MIKNQDFNQLVDAICTKKDNIALRSVIEKELLHYDILFALSNHGMLDKLTFQGGTSLRLCYGLKRFSEDLDFVGGVNFSQTSCLKIKSILERFLHDKYGLEVIVKPPKSDKNVCQEKTAIRITEWQIAILTHPAQKDIPKQKIRLEIANVPAYTRKLKPLLSNYDALPDGYAETFLYVESLEEILADKIIAFVGRNYIKARDLWDIQWLHQKKVVLDLSLVTKKIKDYHLKDFQNILQNRISLLNNFVKSQSFVGEMSRFLESHTIENTLKKPGFDDYLIEVLTEVLQGVLAQ